MNWSEMLSTSLQAVLLAVIAAIGVWVRGFLKEKNLNKGVTDALLEGIQKAEDELVRNVKTAPGVKLTPPQVDQARTMAIDHAIKNSSEAVRNVINSWSRVKLNSVLTDLVEKRK